MTKIKNRLSFKIQKRQKWDILKSCDIKLDGKDIGYINEIGGLLVKEDNPNIGKFYIMLRIHKESTKENPSKWKYIYLKAKFETISDAQQFMINKKDELLNKFNFYKLKD
jgi:hypothetical protein